MQRVFDRLVEELEKPRTLTAQTLRYLTATYGVERHAVGTFLDERLPGLEEDELDLTLSAQFTPKLADQAVFAELLESESIPVTELPAWVERLHRRPTLGHLVTADGTVHGFTFQPVTLERYVFRLRLEGTLAEPLLRLIRNLPTAGDQPRLLAIARRAIWNTPERSGLLQRFLSRIAGGVAPVVGDAEALLALMESSEPSGIGDVCSRIPAWEKVVRTQLSSAEQPSPFFNERVQDLHGGGRDQRRGNESLRAQKLGELEFLGRLGRLLAD